MPKAKSSLYKYLFIGIIFLCLFLIWHSLNKDYENFSERDKEHIQKIKKFNWWAEDPNNSETRPLFDILFKNHINKFNEIHIHSVFGELKEIHKNALRVQYSGEAKFNDPKLFDINIIPGDHSDENVLTIPYMLTPLLFRNVNLSIYTHPRKLQKPKTKFCLFAVSNANNNDRNNFFNLLGNYKKVDSCGKVFNNLGHSCPGKDHLSPEFFEFISDYKFMICFENSSVTHYLTEKLFNAYSSGTIPIYWGCPNIEEYVNLSSILYLKPNYTEKDLNKLIKTIIKLDNNDELYRKKYESVFFKDGRIPDMLNTDILQNKIDKMIDKKLRL